MSHRADRVGRCIDAHFGRRLHVALDERCNLAVESCRKKHRLMLFGDVTQHPFDLRHKTLVGHAICFVEHDHFDVAQICLAVFHQVD